MKELEDFVRNLKGKRKEFDPYKPARCWSEDDLILGKRGKAFVILLRTGGCSWSKKSGCTMCGYFNESLNRGVSKEELLSQVDEALSRYKGEECVKIFTSGSFLDEAEISGDIQVDILKRVVEKENIKKICVESRPEFVKEERLRKLKKIPEVLEVAIGLESANDEVLEYCINKGFTFEDYRRAVSILKKEGIRIKTYVLIKPPFLREFEAIEDCVETVKKIRKLTEVVSFNPVSVHKNTLVEYLWRNGEYRPPWLWSIVEIMRKSKEIAPDLEFKCDVTGKERGAHNCNRCNKKVLDAIKEFSLSQDTKVFNKIDCECREIWQEIIDLGPFSYDHMAML